MFNWIWDAQLPSSSFQLFVDLESNLNESVGVNNKYAVSAKLVYWLGATLSRLMY